MARLLIGAMLLAVAFPALGQPPFAAAPPPPPPPPPPPVLPEGEFTLLDASVGYIDSAPPADQVRLRADFGYDFRTPTRAEFFYPRPRPFGPGLPQPERAVDFQDYSLYLEKTLGPSWSVFAEGGVRALNPDLNDNLTGLADANVGFKYAFLSDECEIWTFQFRAYVPTGAASHGLGTHHVSLEPAVLGFVRVTEDLGVAAELRYWQPIDGTDFAGPVVRYGLGLRYNLWDNGDWRFAPIVEAIGWSVLDGRESRLMPDGTTAVLDAGGTTAVNLKLGARLDMGERTSLYAGYGRALTGERWYRDVVRVEFRWLY
ncbi:MAG TPA: hypothetical protein VKE40_12190 [Gemmataceae bacterium]|nr:hypothetical protein [Gemmataceae bacterium]